MLNIFLVTSGLNVQSGQVSQQTRFTQTIETAKSVKKHVSDAVIILLEGGKYSLTLNQRLELLQVYDDIFDYTYHPTIKFAHDQNVDAGYIKGPCESFMLHEACKVMPKDAKRFFKLSGRYQLSDEFNINNHDVSGKYVFKTIDPGVRYYHDKKDEPGSQLQNIEKYYTPYQYKTRLYSFCGSLLEQATQNYQNIFQCMVNSYINHGFIDIEHSTYRVVDPKLIHTINPVGLTGVQAENSVLLKE